MDVMSEGRVLVVDDDPDVKKIRTPHPDRRQGTTSSEAEDGEMGVATVKSGEDADVKRDYLQISICRR